MTGTPLEAKKRLQFNLPIQPQSKIDLMKNLPVALHPMFWVEEVNKSIFDNKKIF